MTNEPVLGFRETQILELLKEGYTYREIAQRIGRSVPTVKVYMRLIFARLGAKNATQAVAIAIRQKLING